VAAQVRDHQGRTSVGAPLASPGSSTVKESASQSSTVPCCSVQPVTRDIEIRWDEMTPLGDQIAGRMADPARASNQLLAALSEQIQAATAQATAAAEPGAPEDHQPDVSTAANPAGMPAPAAGLPPQARQARQIMIENLRRSLQYVTSPRQRQMMLDQYRAMGIDLTPEELGF
jgi:hypothetical protein